MVTVGAGAAASVPSSPGLQAVASARVAAAVAHMKILRIIPNTLPGRVHLSGGLGAAMIAFAERSFYRGRYG
ncbi:hypothetical protein GCM10012284_34660 [Mangrovihabitans endophyticus]|uniref:Uncharacterized protein n=1 Tax=Mangrovihabitans endophyticus TaxID=1751298 RepID=A0A8J3BZR7_9ACTN|nr:hypothetical protein GCM10012284_34660 [Mangrovihabitans endophyticus]